jgi:hypothetical protein
MMNYLLMNSLLLFKEQDGGHRDFRRYGLGVDFMGRQYSTADVFLPIFHPLIKYN